MKQLKIKKDKKVWPPTFVKAKFLRRPNRFLAHCLLEDGSEVIVHVPNPGRLWELLLPKVDVLLADHRGSERKTEWSLIAIMREGQPIMVDTGHSNQVVEDLLEEKRIPSLASWHMIRREVKRGNSRFDFLLGNSKGEEMLLEVKSCTLFGGDGAMFPDAPTERGERHLLHLQEEALSGQKVGVLLLAQWLQAKWFSPDYHTDPSFAKTMVAVREDVPIVVVAIGWDEELKILPKVNEIPIRWELTEKENHDEGCYVILLEIEEDQEIQIGSLGLVEFPKGWYVYCGSAKKNLTARVNRHLRIRKGIHWHLDYLRQIAKQAVGIPFRTQDEIEHSLSTDLSELADWKIDGFGCSDCDCDSHLYGFSEDPRKRQGFIDFLLFWRIGRLAIQNKKK